MSRPTRTNLSISNRATSVVEGDAGFITSHVQYAVDTGYVLFQPQIGAMNDAGCIEPIYWYHGDNDSTTSVIWPDPDRMLVLGRSPIVSTGLSFRIKSSNLNADIETKLKNSCYINGAISKFAQSTQTSTTGTSKIKYIVRDNQTYIATTQTNVVKCTMSVYVPYFAQVSTGQPVGGYYQILQYTGEVNISVSQGDEVDFYVYAGRAAISDSENYRPDIGVPLPATIGDTTLYFRVFNVTTAESVTGTMIKDSQSFDSRQMFFGQSDMLSMQEFFEDAVGAANIVLSSIAGKTGVTVDLISEELDGLQEQIDELSGGGSDLDSLYIRG